MQRNCLVLFTNSYPFGTVESFIENEIETACQEYERVIILAAAAKGAKREVPENCEVVEFKWPYGKNSRNKFSEYSFLKACLKDFSLSSQDLLLKVKAFNIWLKFYKEQKEKAHLLNALINELGIKVGQTLFYDYWFTNTGLALALLQNSYPSLRFISRAHRYDLYDEVWMCPIPFRNVVVNAASYIFPCSEDGSNYFRSRIAERNREKIVTGYLGVKDHGISKMPSSDAFHIASCSSIIQRKGVDKIIQALSLFKNINFIWTHIGDGPEYGQMVNMAKENLPSSSFRFIGQKSNKEVIQFYKENEVDLLLNLSESEGLPVSIMEANSFGIPCIALDVNGNREIVLPGLGLLIKESKDIAGIAEVVRNCLKFKSRNFKFRATIREVYSNHFSTKNFNTFYKLVKSI